MPCPPVYVIINVNDPKGNPIPNAEIDSKPPSVIRFESGKYVLVSPNGGGSYKLTISAPGYETMFSDPITLQIGNNGELPPYTLEYAKPILYLPIYHNTESIRISLPPLPEGKNQYVGIAIPNDPNIYVFTGVNSFEKFNGVTLPRWTSGDEVLDSPILPGGNQLGRYTVYLLRVGADIEKLLTHIPDWMLGMASFELTE